MAKERDHEKSKRNIGFINTLTHLKTYDWEGEKHNPYALVKLRANSKEFSEVKTLFDLSCYGKLYVRDIQRVENPFLLAQYLLKKTKMENENSYIEERRLFHGTSHLNVDGICRNNFDWRRRGQARGHKFGQGVSFSPQSYYASHYSKCGRVMFLVNVLVGRSSLGNCSTVIPPSLYDTTQNAAGTVIVKYEDNDFYPEYIIYYT